MSGLMAGKRGLIMGLANDKSIAWGIARQLAEHGAEMAFSYQGEALKKRVGPLAEQLVLKGVRDMLGLTRTRAVLSGGSGLSAELFERLERTQRRAVGRQQRVRARQRLLPNQRSPGREGPRLLTEQRGLRQAGSRVEPGEKLFRIVDHSRLWLDVRVYERDIPFVGIGQEVSLRARGEI